MLRPPRGLGELEAAWQSAPGNDDGKQKSHGCARAAGRSSVRIRFAGRMRLSPAVPGIRAASNASMEIAIDIAVSRRGAGVATGDLGQGVDRRGEGLGSRPGCFATKVIVAPELAHAARKGEDHAGDDAGENERQGLITRKTPDRAGAERGGGIFQPAVDRPRSIGGSQRTISGNPHHCAGECGTSPSERRRRCRNARRGTGRGGPAAAEQQQQQITGHHRRP